MLLVRDSADNFAGLWVAQQAASKLPSEHNLPKEAVSALSDATMGQLGGDWAERHAASATAVKSTFAQLWGELLDAAWTEYARDRDALDWYRRCLGKQTLSRTATALDFKSGEALERQVVGLWNSGEVDLPPDLVELRAYVGGVGG